jgi:hypothetical protein
MITSAFVDGVSGMEIEDKVRNAIERSLPYMPPEARAEVLKLLDPAAIALLTGTLVIWASAHFVGVGEIADVVLLTVGVVLLGTAVAQVAEHLMAFAKGATNARNEHELEVAGHHLARAVAIVGINVTLAVLLHSAGKAFRKRPAGSRTGFPELETPLPPGKVKIKYSPRLAPGTGFTSAYGEITVSSEGLLEERRLVKYHELVHAFLSPKFAFLRQFRARFRISAYQRSAFLKYIEEALAELYAQLRVNGFSGLPTGIKFPVGAAYVTVDQLMIEGAAVGAVSIGTAKFYVTYIATDDSGTSK